MRTILQRAASFACVAALLVLGADAFLSLVVQSPPPVQYRAAFFISHVTFHGAVVSLSAIGAALGFLVIRTRLPSSRQCMLLAASYGFVTLLAGPGSFMLAGVLGGVAWLVLGSMAFAVGSGIFSKSWRRPPLV